jgi:hypothetical protein
VREAILTGGDLDGRTVLIPDGPPPRLTIVEKNDVDDTLVTLDYIDTSVSNGNDQRVYALEV